MGRVVAYSVVFFFVGNLCGQIGPANLTEALIFIAVLLAALGIGEGIAAWRRSRSLEKAAE